eukprot:COSAG02_NODE_3452_length_6717_cov_11.574645_6_plen_61_part_00
MAIGSECGAQIESTARARRRKSLDTLSVWIMIFHSAQYHGKSEMGQFVSYVSDHPGVCLK